LAVVLDYKKTTDKDGKVQQTPLDKAELDRITELVKKAVGFDASRNDSINVINLPFQETAAGDLEEDGGWLHDMGMAAAPVSVVADQPRPPAASASASGKRPGEVIATYTAHYRLGQADYDEIFSLIDAKTQVNVGTCGMGVTSPGGYREQHPEEVIALNIWLFDKMDTENVRSYQRVLISEYVIDSGKEADYENIRGAVGKPIVAQSGLDFTIEGENLLMACRVLEANYVQNGASKGVFQDVKVEMSVMKKG